VTGDRDHSFSGTLAKQGILYCVDIPERISLAIGRRGRVPVTIAVNGGFPFHGTMVPRGGGKHRLFLNSEARGGARTGKVAVTFRVETEPREVAIPPDLEDALREGAVMEGWTSLPVGKRAHIVQWIEEAAHEETRLKRVARAVEEAESRREKDLDRRR
jgi:hypothetical protein